MANTIVFWRGIELTAARRRKIIALEIEYTQKLAASDLGLYPLDYMQEVACRDFLDTLSLVKKAVKYGGGGAVQSFDSYWLHCEHLPKIMQALREV